jgi:hypothetical protein
MQVRLRQVCFIFVNENGSNKTSLGHAQFRSPVRGLVLAQSSSSRGLKRKRPTVSAKGVLTPRPPGRCTSLTPPFLRLVMPCIPCPALSIPSTLLKTPQRSLSPPLKIPVSSLPQGAVVHLPRWRVEPRPPPPPRPQVPVVDAATVASEARRSAAAVRKRKNATDLASTQVHVQRLREEN